MAEPSLESRRVMGKLKGSLVNRVFVIRNKKTGLFSRGVSYPSWGKRARTFDAIGHVRGHSNGKKEFYKDAEIVEMELIEIKTHPIRNEKTK